MQNQDTSRGLNILCIDGGGVRGLSSLIILQEIMHSVANANVEGNHYPHEYFDIIAGTGTGGISACMLGRLRMPIEKAISEYAKLVKEVFQDIKFTGTTMYKATKLQEALKTMILAATGDEGEMMNERREHAGCRTRVVYDRKHNLNAGLPVLFRSYNVGANPGPDCTIREALHATMAHPDLFKSISIVDSSVAQSFVGGEIGCSNPIAHVLSELKRVYPGRQVSSIISIGAGHARTIQVPNPSRWHRTKDVIVMKDMATDSERVAEEMATRFEGTTNIYFRFNVDQGMQNMKDGSWERLGEVIQHTRAYLRKGEVNRKLEAAVRTIIERRGAMSTTHATGNISHIVDVSKQFAGFKRCPAPTKFYTGREDEIRQLMGSITEEKNKLRVCVVYGLGGVGKTQLALSVIERTWDNWDHVIYVDASSTEAIEKALEEFGKTKNIDHGYKEVISWLESCGERWLMVLDNADTPTIDVEQYIPARGQHGSIMITTRLPDLANLANDPGSVCHLSSMSQADGTALLVKIICSGNQRISDDDRKAVEELVQDFGCLALAIVHAGAYIAHSRGITVTEYRSLFLSQRQRMLDEYSKLPATAKLDKRGDTVYTTWRMCYNQLKPESCELLWLIAYLHYDGISVNIFKRAAQQMHSKSYPLPLTDLESQAQSRIKQYLSAFIDAEGIWDSVSFARVMSDLVSYSLVEFDRLNMTYRVHVLVHDWARTVVPQSIDYAIECTTTLLSLSIDQDNDIGSLAFKRQLGLHVTSVLAHNPDLRANHGYYFKEVYRETGQWSQMIELMQQQVRVYQQELGDNDLITWAARSDLAHAYSELGRWDEALDLRTQVLDAHKRLHGEEHFVTLESMRNLAITYSDLGRHNEAEQLQVQALDAHKRLLGEYHPITLTSMNSLASTYSDMGRYEEAEQLKAQVLEARKQILGEEHPDTMGSMNNLANTYLDLGRQNEAQQLQVRVLEAHKRLLGEYHPNTLTFMNNLASTYSDMGRHNEAEQLQVQTLDARKRVLGEFHPDTLASMNNLAGTYSHLGRHSEAQQLQVQVLDIRRRLLGEEHPSTLTSMGNLANTYSNLGRHDEAEELNVQVFEASKRVLGENHPATLSSMHNLANTYSDLDRHNEALQLKVKVLDVRKRVLGEDHPHTLNSMGNLASTYSYLGRDNEAEQLEVQVLNARKRVLGEDHPHTINSMGNLALTYSQLGRWDEAEELFCKAIGVAESTLGDQHPDTQRYRRGLEWSRSQREQHLVSIFCL
ncbi:unnamed protein product [Rhizoctonia solani]|uniref:PNPLA domain-containing protein n=1 Tax=Rhizoctonia solani TaxID=456999 RepID=A0A8H2WQ48_9AGAM|nr:unnamed protein product [Rhizoctonia solani]